MVLSFNFEPYLIAICSGFLFLVIFLICRTSKVINTYYAFQFVFENLVLISIVY